jgi:nicotinamide mononucleotide transporter
MNESNITQLILDAAQAMSWMEVVGVIAALGYTILAAREIIWCWLSAIISIVMYLFILYDVQLYAEMGLQVFYFIMAIVGWMQWRKRPTTTQGETVQKAAVEIRWWSLNKHLLAFIGGALGTIVMGYILSTNTDAALPYFDSFTTVFSIITTWMMVQKVMENWLYWVVIDGLSVYLYVQRELYLTSLLFAIYTVIVLWGFYSWYKILEQNQEYTMQTN